jgi:hypothetical protein
MIQSAAVALKVRRPARTTHPPSGGYLEHGFQRKLQSVLHRVERKPETCHRPSPSMEGIGLALDPKGGRMFITDFGGSIYSANLDGSDRRTLQIALANLTGIAYVELP